MGMQLNVDFSGIEPDEGGARSYLPVSDSKGWLVTIEDTKGQETAKKDGHMLVVTFKGVDQPVFGRTMDAFINVANPSPDATRIGRAQASAIAHCIGVIKTGNTQEWHGKQLRIVVVSDASEKYPNATRIAAFHDVNGNTAKNAGQGAMQQGNQGGGNFGGGNQGNQSFGGGNQGQGNPASGDNGGGFGNQGGNQNGGGFGGGNGGGGSSFGNQGNQGGGFDPNAGNGNGGGNFGGGNNGGGNFQQGGGNGGGWGK